MRTLNNLKSKQLKSDITKQLKAGNEGTIPTIPYSESDANNSVSAAGQAIYNTGAAIWNAGATSVNAGLAALGAFFDW